MKNGAELIQASYINEYCRSRTGESAIAMYRCAGGLVLEPGWSGRRLDKVSSQ